ncbi:MAG: RNA-binding protein [Mesorhizobium sp.]|nr:RNA-binding protein [Mesorhizobium sp. M1A.T.Ca.IN.004.03.1.1]RWG23288.1 MAG: RNA-binding protein [Mesorhizobium sp.]RWG60513.1 MAG: RNA-binding protein [Mesorhizobium sp.]RWH42112.1 MAG: RNA-binding protein [Mesorhizobium sp.]RWK30841.1 MAG: RNA-binding protein [Mesorhizobium sp.]
MSTSHCSGVYRPADLDMLQRVFDRLCAERRLAFKDREQRDALARDVINLFQDGVTEEDALWRSISRLRTAKDA